MLSLLFVFPDSVFATHIPDPPLVIEGNGSASPDPADTSVTISVSGGSGAALTDCGPFLSDPVFISVPYHIQTVTIISEPFTGQTLNITITQAGDIGYCPNPPFSGYYGKLETWTATTNPPLNTSGLANGTYTVIVRALNDAGKINSANVSFSVSHPSSTGTIFVSSNLNTGWIITGPQNFSGTGTSNGSGYIAVPGSYTISADSIAGYNLSISPSSTQTLNGGSSITFQLNYSAIPPPSCGNGVIDSGEQCDNGANNGTCPRTCSSSCTINDCSTPTPTPPPCSGNCAQFISQSVPNSVAAGSAFSAPITMRNIGTNTWYTSPTNTAYKLGSLVGNTWGIQRVYLNGATVAPGSNWTWTVDAVAPTTPGPYNFQWQMIQENVEWFGDITPNVSINVSTPPTPTASNVIVTQPDYCVSGPAATVNWTYSDPGASPQSAYQVQIDNQDSFNSPEWDSGKVFSSGTSNSTPQGLLQFHTTYRARVRVWNSADIVSGWATSSTWNTPRNAFPQVNFIFASTQGQQIVPNVPVQFTDQTTFFDGNPNGRRWSWFFGDGGSSTQQNPQYTYINAGTYNTTLTATDNADQSCSLTKPVNVQLPNPIWKEVNPGG